MQEKPGSDDQLVLSHRLLIKASKILPKVFSAPSHLLVLGDIMVACSRECVSLTSFTKEAARKTGWVLIAKKVLSFMFQEEAVFRSLCYLRPRRISVRKHLCDLLVPLVALCLLGKSIYNARGNTPSKIQALVGGHNQLPSQGSIFSWQKTSSGSFFGTCPQAGRGKR